MEEIKNRLERGYTMAIYGTSESLHEQMRSDIEILLEALSIADVVGRSEQLVCDCLEHTYYEWEKEENKCCECGKPLYAN